MVEIPETGEYTFGPNTDDGQRLTIDQTVLTSDHTPHAVEDRFGTITLAAGTHSVELVEFFGGAAVELFAAKGALDSSGNDSIRICLLIRCVPRRPGSGEQ